MQHDKHAQKHIKNHGVNPSLNSFSGISVNVTDICVTTGDYYCCPDSQFPFWDFGECNIVFTATLAGALIAAAVNSLNSLSGISLNVTSRKDIWFSSLSPTLNSLSGISLNVTRVRYAKLNELFICPSQFPFWDFVECNLSHSIP
jgi:hypothetical protein